MRSRPLPLLVLAVVLGLGAPAYCGAYGWARLTGELVSRGSHIGRPLEHSGFSLSSWEFAFLPLTELERVLRGL